MICLIVVYVTTMSAAENTQHQSAHYWKDARNTQHQSAHYWKDARNTQHQSAHYWKDARNHKENKRDFSNKVFCR